VFGKVMGRFCFAVNSFFCGQSFFKNLFSIKDFINRDRYIF